MSLQLVQNRYILKWNFFIKPTLMSWHFVSNWYVDFNSKINSFVTFESYVHDLTLYLFESIGSVSNEIWREENQVFQLRNELKVRSCSRYFQIHRFCRVTYVEKVRNYIKEVWLILKKWVWRVDFERFLSVLAGKIG